MAKSFDQYLAETGRQSTLDELRRTFKYDAAKSEYDRTGSYGQSSSDIPGSSINFTDILKNVQKTISESFSPIVSKIEGQAPAITQAYGQAKNTLQTQKSSLTDKYQKLLADIKNVGARQTESATKTTNSELARRGITGDSTAAQQEIQNVVAPIDERILASSNQATMAQGEEEATIANALANLAISEQSAQSGILSQVASLLSGGASQASGIAGNIYSQLLGAEQAGKKTDAEKLYADLQNQLLQQNLKQSEALAPLEQKKIEAEIKKLLNPTTKFDGDISAFWS